MVEKLLVDASQTAKPPTTDSAQRILVTGGAGFIGSHVVAAFVQAGWSVAVVDNLSMGHRENLADWPVYFYEVDILDSAALEKVFAEFKPTHISHHAAQINVRHSLSDPATDAQINIIGTINVLQLAVKYQCLQLVFASSGGAIYGENEQHQPADEQTAKQPTSPYGLSKLAAEQYIAWFSQQTHLPVTILRYANVFGPRQDPAGEAGVITLFLERFVQNKPVTIFGSGKQVRDFIYVGDVANANLLACQKRVTGTYNIGSGRITSISQLFRQLATVWLDQTGQNPLAPVHEEAIVGEVEWSQLDVSTVNQKLGWQPSHNLEQGLSETVKWARSVADSPVLPQL